MQGSALGQIDVSTSGSVENKCGHAEECQLLTATFGCSEDVTDTRGSTSLCETFAPTQVKSAKTDTTPKLTTPKLTRQKSQALASAMGDLKAQSDARKGSGEPGRRSSAREAWT